MDVGAPSCSDTDTSDDEDLLPYSSTLGSSDVQIFSERRQRLQRSITKLRQRRTSYLALVGIHEQGNATCSEELHGLFDRVDRNRLALQTRVDALETERRQNVGFKEQLEHIEVRFHCKLREVEEQKAETDQRIQDLMDRLVTLLSAPFIDAVTQDRIVQEFTDALSSLDLKFSRAKVQLDQALDENRAIALRVTDAQRFTTRLDEELCHRQGYLFEAARKRPTRNRLTFREGQIPGESPRVKLGDSSQVSSQKMEFRARAPQVRHPDYRSSCRTGCRAGSKAVLLSSCLAQCSLMRREVQRRSAQRRWMITLSGRNRVLALELQDQSSMVRLKP